MKKLLLMGALLTATAAAGFAAPPVIDRRNDVRNDRTDVRIDRTEEMRVPAFLMNSSAASRTSSIQLFDNKQNTPPRSVRNQSR